MLIGIQEEALRALVEGGALRDMLVSREEVKWTLAIGVFQGSCRVNRSAMPLFVRSVVPDPDQQHRSYWFPVACLP